MFKRPHLQLKESELETAYQKYLKEGFYPEFAKIKAKIECSKKRMANLSRPLTVNVSGVGNCQYTGD